MLKTVYSISVLRKRAEDADGKQVSQFEFAEDPSVKQEFLKLDYNLADLCS